jgi:anti-sigma factor RsiW
MSQSQLIELMHVVLDGEATPAQAGELERRMRSDAAARAQYEELRCLFDGLSRVRQAFPPEGLIASVLANIPQNSTRPGRSGQLFGAPGVIETSLKDTRGRSPGRGERVRQVFQQWASSRGTDMSAGKNNLAGNRKIWIGGGIAAAAVIVAVSTGLFPPNAGDTAGTIAPALRYRATQPAADDVTPGSQPGSQSAQTNPAGTASAGAGNAGNAGNAANAGFTR